MPVLATAQKEAQLTHVIQALLQQHMTLPLVEALEKHFGSGHVMHEDVGNILGMSCTDINALTCNFDQTDD